METKLEVSFEEMLMLSRKNEDEYNFIRQWYTKKDWTSELKSLEYQRKSDKRAEVMKNMGNTIYALGDFPTAIDTYTEALLFANHNSETYGTILANISSCLYEMKLLTKCVIYIDECLSSSYPNTSRPKLHVRKIKALRRLGRKSCAAEATSEYKKFISQRKISPADKEKYFKFVQEPMKENEEYYEYFGDYIIPEFKENPNILNVCMSATLKHNKKNGRHIVAQNVIKKGEAILIEKPYASVGQSRCPNCFKCLKKIIPCDNCPGIMYCSKLCREQDDQVHRWECKFYQLQKFRKLHGVVRLAFRIFLKGLQGGYKTNLKEVKEELRFGDKSDNFPYVRQMNGSFSEIPISHQILILDACCILLACIATEKKLKEWIRSKIGNDQFLIGKYLLQLMVNCDENTKSYTAYGAGACNQLYPSLSLFNHSCVPNTSLCIQDDILVMRALKDIRPGEQIFINYLEEMNDLPYEIRQNVLSTMYSFTCHCSLCTSETENRGKLPCPFCQMYSDVIDGTLTNCKSCGILGLPWDKILKLKAIADALQIYDTFKDINVLYDGIKVAQEIQMNPNCIYMFEICMKYIMQCVKLGNLDQSTKCLQYTQNVQFIKTARLLNFDLVAELTILVKKTCYLNEWHIPKYKISTLLQYEKYLVFLHDFFSLHNPVESVLKDIKKIQMFLSMQKQIIEFKEASDWVN